MATTGFPSNQSSPHDGSRKDRPVKISAARERYRNSIQVGEAPAEDSDARSAVSSVKKKDSRGQIGLPISDRELVARSRETAKAVDLHDVVASIDNSSWKLVKSSDCLSVFTRQLEPNAPEVLCHGRMENVSLQELANILHVITTPDFTVAMRSLHSRDFIAASVDRTVSPEATTLALDPAIGESGNSNGEVVSVKSCTFVHADLFGKNGQWCFLEHFQRKPERDGFTLSVSSLLPDESTTSKLNTDRVDQLHGLTASCLVEQAPARQGVLVTFYARYDGSCPIGQRDLAASAKVASARMTLLAKGMTKLPEIVRRRRFGIQRLADLSAFSAKNSRCTCCTRSFWVFTKKKRCYLCGNFVCDDCWSLEQMETYNGHLAGIVICTQCCAWVNACDYSRVRPHEREPIRVQPEPEPSEDSYGKQLVAFLDTLTTTSPTKERQSAALSVIRTILDDEQSSSEGSTTSSPLSDDMEAAFDQFHRHLRSNRLTIDECVLGNAESRNYPLEMPAQIDELITSPIPADEARRLELIDRYDLSHLKDVPALEIICELAALEMRCPSVLMTVMAKATQYVLAANISDLKDATFDRNQTCCQHTMMTGKPMALRYPTSDVRFRTIPSIRDLDVQFYVGYPITSSCGTVVGTLCCFDTAAHDLSQSQYSTMTKLAKAASRILEAEAHRRSPHRPVVQRPTNSLR